ncbi:hypothetical protein PVAND_001722 [Polypedilum vanderplanki]|uniref:protein-histidine N-methyltransferase n=1 Tax=Polypedilum vanderplanki TaxID=319348 RepID=A0A9J6BP84_POLVA|nr:hypothetical protein PVAND_001722 [Polypedilum vanderplanki]
MFKFNFNSENDENNEKESMIEDKTASTVAKESKLIEFNSNQYAEISESLPNYSCQMFTSNEVEIGYIENLKINENSKSDLESGIYEGGFKIWECTQDLADYFTNEYSQNEFEGKIVCDLGCSAGILGILALKKGAKVVHFQDYNDDVLQNSTVFNVVLNCEEEEIPEAFNKCSFYSGDWDNFRELTSNQDKYDIILTSETIYNPQNYLKLTNFFKSRLKKDGKIFLAAKSHYFGVGGNTFDFCKHLNDDGAFSHEIIWKSSEGLKREILLIQFK